MGSLSAGRPGAFPRWATGQRLTPDPYRVTPSQLGGFSSAAAFSLGKPPPHLIMRRSLRSIRGVRINERLLAAPPWALPRLRRICCLDGFVSRDGRLRRDVRTRRWIIFRCITLRASARVFSFSLFSLPFFLRRASTQVYVMVTGARACYSYLREVERRERESWYTVTA